MNSFLVFGVLALSASINAALLPSSGYNYQQQNQPSLLQQQQTLASFAQSGQQNLLGNGGGGGSLTGLGSSSSGSFASLGSNLGGLNQQSFGSGLSQQVFGGGHHSHLNLQPQRLAPIVTKDIFVHSAPEEPEEDIHHNYQIQPPRKHYRIIFIKTPSQSSRSAALRFAQAQAQTEEKTVIYVLSKKTDAADIHAALQAAPALPPSKPEVFFIKYKTQAEAAHAQQQIQAQYDSLGGTSHVSDEGIAPITSVIGALGNGGVSQLSGSSSNDISFGSAAGLGVSSSGSGISSGNGAAYLPPVHK